MSSSGYPCLRDRITIPSLSTAAETGSAAFSTTVPSGWVHFSLKSTGSRWRMKYRQKLGSWIVNGGCRPFHSLSDAARCPSFTMRRASSRSSRLRRNGVSLSQSPISAAVLPQPRHHPVFWSRRQTSMHGDCTRFALRPMEEPRLEFPVRAHDGVRQSERLIRPTKPPSVPSARCCPSADQASAVTAPSPGRLTTAG